MNPSNYIFTLAKSLEGLEAINSADFRQFCRTLKMLGKDKQGKKKHIEKYFQALRESFENQTDPQTRKDNAKMRLRQKLAQKQLTK